MAIYDSDIPSKSVRFGLYLSGRASRTSYWVQMLMCLFCFTAILSAFGFSYEIFEHKCIIMMLFLGVILTGAWAISVAIRRIHDFGYPACVVLLGFIPYCGLIAWIIFGVIPSQEGENKYGTKPDVIK